MLGVGRCWVMEHTAGATVCLLSLPMCYTLWFAAFGGVRYGFEADTDAQEVLREEAVEVGPAL